MKKFFLGLLEFIGSDFADRMFLIFVVIILNLLFIMVTFNGVGYDISSSQISEFITDNFGGLFLVASVSAFITLIPNIVMRFYGSAEK